MSARSDNPEAWALWAVLAPVLGAVVGFGGAYSYVWVPVSIALLSGLVALAVQRLLRNRPWRFHPLLLPMSAFGALVAVQWLFSLSAYPGATLSAWILLAADGCAFYLAWTAGQRASAIRAFARVLWLFCGALSAEALLQHFSSGNFIYWFHDASYAQPMGPFVYHNHFAGCICLLLPIAVTYSWGVDRTTDWMLRLRRGMVPLLAFVAVVVSQSRGGVLAICAEAGLWIVFSWPRLRSSRSLQVALASGCGLALLFAFLAGSLPLLQRFAALGNGDISFQARVRIAQAALRMFRSHPWIGMGFGSFASVYPGFQTFENGLQVLYAHNEFAQVLAETGLAGAICVLAFLILFLRTGLSLRRRSTESAGAVQLACFIGASGLIVHSLGDFQFHSPANALLFFVLAGVAVSEGKRRDKRPRSLELKISSEISASP